MPLFRLALASICLAILVFIASVDCFIHQSPNTPRESASSVGCTECGLLYKFCPSNVGCGMADPSGITCYCKDWSWCSDSPDCSTPTPLADVPTADSILPVVLRSCNTSDFRQWILMMDPICSNGQELVFAPRDENNDIFVLTKSNVPISGYTIFAAYVYLFNPYFDPFKTQSLLLYSVCTSFKVQKRVLTLMIILMP